MEEAKGESSHNTPKSSFMERAFSFYHNNYKTLLYIPLILLILAILQIGYQTATTGDFVKKGIAFTGGVSIGVETSYSDIPGLEKELKSIYPEGDISTRLVTRTGRQEAIMIEANKQVDQEKLIKSIKQIISKEEPSINDQEFNIQDFSPDFASDFFRTTIVAVIIAFIFMAITVTLYFRVAIPSLAVVGAAFADIVITVAVFNLLGQKLVPGGIAAFLMLIGYSVDTDILLSTRVLKEKFGSVNSRMNSAFKTGILMSLTSMGAVAVGYIFAEADIIKQIMLVLFIGLCTDIVVTWLQNTAILKWHVNKKGIQ